MFKMLKITAVILFAVLMFCGFAHAALVESNAQTFTLGEKYTMICAAEPAGNGEYIAGALHDGNLTVFKTDKNSKKLWSIDLDGNYVHSIKSLSDGGCIVISSAGDNLCLYKLDKDGKAVWVTPLAGVCAGVNPISVSNDKIKFAGWFADTKTGFTQSFSLSSGAPANDQLKLEDGFVPLSIIQDGNSYVLVGETDTAPISRSSKAWILKMNDGGKVEWKTVIRTQSDLPKVYGPGSAAFAVCKAEGGEYFVCGTSTPYNVSYSEIEGVIWGAKISSSGDVKWHKDLSGSIPYGVEMLGRDYVVAGIGWDTPFLMSVTEGGAIGEINYSEDKKISGGYATFAKVSENKAVAGGWLVDGTDVKGYLAECENSGVAKTPAPVFGALAGLATWLALIGLKRRS